MEIVFLLFQIFWSVADTLISPTRPPLPKETRQGHPPLSQPPWARGASLQHPLPLLLFSRITWTWFAVFPATHRTPSLCLPSLQPPPLASLKPSEAPPPRSKSLPYDDSKLFLLFPDPQMRKPLPPKCLRAVFLPFQLPTSPLYT